MILGPAIDKRTVRLNGDLGAPFYRLFWGRHIHHGFWDGEQTPAQAQNDLMQAAIGEARLRRGERVLDVGCGLGASAVCLAQDWECHVTGVTLSPVQRLWACCGALRHGVRRNTRFIAADAESVSLEPAAFDLIWVVESVEYLFDKPAFVRRLAEWLKPGGRAMLCNWEAADAPLSEKACASVYDVCSGFGLPSLASGEEFARWFAEAGLHIESRRDWTPHVFKTWEISRRLAERSRVHWLAPLFGRKRLPFWDHYLAILTAYRTGAMKYECWVVSKPTTNSSAVVRDVEPVVAAQ